MKRKIVGWVLKGETSNCGDDYRNGAPDPTDPPTGVPTVEARAA